MLNFRQKSFLLLPSLRSFRSTFKNPYLTETIKLTEAEREEQASLPVWERKFDQRKYMEHTGEIKVRPFLDSPLLDTRFLTWSHSLD